MAKIVAILINIDNKLFLLKNVKILKVMGRAALISRV